MTNFDKVLERLEPKLNRNNPQIATQIIEFVSGKFYLVPEDLKSKKRDETTALARQLAMYLFRQETDYTLARVGLMLGARTPATVSYGYQRVAENINKSSRLQRLIKEFKALPAPPEVEQGVLTDWQGKVLDFDHLPENKKEKE